MTSKSDQLDNMIGDAMTKEQAVIKYTADLVHEAKTTGGDLEEFTAQLYARAWNKKFDEITGLNKKGETRIEYARRKFGRTPGLIGLRKGGEADGVDKILLQQIRQGNKTSMSRGVALYGLPKMNHIARSEGFKDVFDMASGRNPIAPAASSNAPDKPAARNASGELSPWSPQGWNVTKQAQRFRDDPTAARAEMLKWNAKLGQTKPTRA